MKHSLLHNLRSFFRLLGQHRFYTVVCVVGTAVTIAFVMVVVMVYDFRTADVAPETRRSRVIYNYGTQCMRPDGSNMWGYRALGPTAFAAFFDNLPGVDELTWHGGLSKAVCALPASSDRQSVMLRPVAANWFDFFRYDFVAGRPSHRLNTMPVAPLSSRPTTSGGSSAIVRMAWCGVSLSSASDWHASCTAEPPRRWASSCCWISRRLV